MRFLLPEQENSLYSLHYAILKYFGIKSNSPIEIKKKKGRLLLIIIDGLGFDLAKKISRKAMAISSVFPSSTPSALATLMLGLMPGDHGIFNKTYVKELGGVIVEFPGYELYPSGCKLYNIEIDKLFKFITLFEKLKNKGIKSIGVIKNKIANSAFSSLLYKGAKLFPTLTMFDAPQILNDNARKAEFFVWYIPEVDELLHIYGKDSESVFNALTALTKMIEKLDSFDIVITADHGHININKVTVPKRLTKLDYTHVFGEPRALMIKGNTERKKLEKIFDERKYFIFDKNESLKILGANSDNDRLPDFIVSPKNKEVILIEGQEEFNLETFHGGLTEEEMKIPFIIF